MSSQLEEQEKKERLQNIDPYDFENFVGELWEKEGWTTSVSQDTNDQGIDVIADKKGTIDQRLAIQAKRYSAGNKVGRPKIQQYHSLKEQDTNADAAVVVTTSGFTAHAKNWAREHNVKLVDGDDLVEMVERHGAHDLLDEYAPPLSEIDEEPTKSTSTEQSSDSKSSTTSTSPTTTG
ncbi:restriction endonuclease [Haloplanus halobius]|uniref:restriction endonuclease n=1 Tax=Haloplanus halobius TaxID=2934938 RepID=UPI00200C62A0|nr:restriction endonuclease [Haloplanus sp. XH21]